MATAYHLEALRRQRVLDRAYEASQNLQQRSSETPSGIASVGTSPVADQQDQQDSGPALQHEGPRPPSGLKSRPQSAHGQGRVSTSQPHTTNEGVEPGFSLGANEAALLDQTVVERKGSRPSSACSHSTSLHGRALSPSPDFAGAERKVTSRPASASSSRAESKMEAVRRDLKRQEQILHNSNLVMGPVSVEQEISDKPSPHKIAVGH